MSIKEQLLEDIAELIPKWIHSKDEEPNPSIHRNIIITYKIGDDFPPSRYIFSSYHQFENNYAYEYQCIRILNSLKITNHYYYWMPISEPAAFKRQN